MHFTVTKETKILKSSWCPPSFVHFGLPPLARLRRRISCLPALQLFLLPPYCQPASCHSNFGVPNLGRLLISILTSDLQRVKEIRWPRLFLLHLKSKLIVREDLRDVCYKPEHGYLEFLSHFGSLVAVFTIFLFFTVFQKTKAPREVTSR